MNKIINGTAAARKYNLNSVKLTGTIIGDAVFSHNLTRKSDGATLPFLRFTLEVPRLSGVSDYLQVVTLEETWDAYIDRQEQIVGAGAEVHVSGHLQSYNRFDMEAGKSKLDLFVYARSLGNFMDAEPIQADNNNAVALEGFVCKPPAVRQTPLGRTIADVLVAVNRRGASSYIPVIMWGNNAVDAQSLVIGDKLLIAGRFQSREYTKNIDDETLTLTAYELSASKVKLLENSSLAHF